MITFSNIKTIGKEIVAYLNNFEKDFINEVKYILNSQEYKLIKVEYTMKLYSEVSHECPYKVQHNASFALENSYKFIDAINRYMKERQDELALFIGEDSYLCVDIKLTKKDEETNKTEMNNQNLAYLPIKPRYTFKQIVLSKEIENEIQDAMNLLKYQDLIYQDWGFAEIDPIPKSVINFYGPPGTGKTMCAHAIANNLNKQLLALNYAEIESKYVGDAAKNLTNAFEVAKNNNCVLFFDEADSFLGKRIQNVTHGADQALNSLRSQMLILLEEFSGIVIFATNLVSNFDKAFESRILKHIQFSLPNKEARVAIIKSTIPAKLPIIRKITEDEYYELSTILEGLSGREIKNAIMECILTKVSIEGNKSVFSYSDFEIAFMKKQNSLKALQEEKSKNKSEKILNAIKNGNVNRTASDSSHNLAINDEQI